MLSPMSVSSVPLQAAVHASSIMNAVLRSRPVIGTQPMTGMRRLA
jgi:CHASE2 domain-containing sensor protein